MIIVYNIVETFNCQRKWNWIDIMILVYLYLFVDVLIHLFPVFHHSILYNPGYLSSYIEMSTARKYISY